jgi:DNA polymerase-1
MEKARDMWDSQIDGITRALGSDDMVIVLSGPEDFRRKLEPTYKGNRKGKRKPLGYTVLRDWLTTRHEGRVVSQPCLEADDYLGILATTPNAPERIIVSDDKDLLTSPSKVYRLGVLHEIDSSMAEHNWLYQTLTGDQSDGYKGCPGIGDVKAKAILSKPGDRWQNVELAFLKAGLTRNDALLQARLARILHHSDWDSDNKAPRLWSPSAGGGAG